jgi:hypothetical protein
MLTSPQFIAILAALLLASVEELLPLYHGCRRVPGDLSKIMNSREKLGDWKRAYFLPGCEVQASSAAWPENSEAETSLGGTGRDRAVSLSNFNSSFSSAWQRQ